MKTFSQIYAALRRKNLGQYGLLAGSCFFSVLLITAYACMMQAPTVLSVLPEGGDSRKQVMMIFVLTAIGCAVFTVYAASLFFRYKSTETGIFLALGAKKSVLKAQLAKELSLMALVSCGAGMILGAPLSWLVWQLFRMFVVDSAEMVLRFTLKAWLIPAVFTVFVLAMLLIALTRFVGRTNIMDIVGQSRKSETVKNVPRYFGILGIALTVIGGFGGYMIPSLCIQLLHWYPPEGFSAIFYAPAVVGIYFILLHTVVNGWRSGSNRYKNIVTTSMMKFQGRQTVNNMLVVTVLVAGAFFAAFYTPLLCASGATDFETRSYDYFYHYRADQSMISTQEVEALAEDMDVTITRLASQPAALLGVDGEENVETETSFGVTYDVVYRELLVSATCMSQSAYNQMTGESCQVPKGKAYRVYLDDGTAVYSYGMDDVSILTNVETGQVMEIETMPEHLCCSMLYGCVVLSDEDYAAITQGITPKWQEELVVFNVENCMDTYPFATALFNRIVDCSNQDVNVIDGWDPVIKLRCDETGEAYFMDNENLWMMGEEPLDYSKRDGTNFRLYWKYMPSFRVLDKADMVRSMAVFLMLFVFIALLCFSAVGVILYTRSMTIVMINRRVYEDLGKLGASAAYLYVSVKRQVSRVYFTPCLTGTLIMCGFYTLIIYFNDGGFFSPGELAGLVVCLGVVLAVSAIIYLVYRMTLKKVCRQLNIRVR